MAIFPPLTEDDSQEFENVLRELLRKSEASTALIIEKAGHLIHQVGEDKLDFAILASLTANTFAALQMMATTLGETNFNGMFQEGEKQSLLMANVDEHCVLLLIFRSHLSAGVMKFYAGSAARKIGTQIKIAERRSPGVGIDLTDLNVKTSADAAEILHRKN